VLVAKTTTVHLRDGWALRLVSDGKHWCDWELFQQIAWEAGGTPLYRRKGATSSGDDVRSIDEAECEIDGFVKWDGCHEIRMDQPHGCSPKDMRDLLDAVAWATSEAWLSLNTGEIVGYTLPDGRVYGGQGDAGE
jgi:hypothetical protein